jgi:hypothetical protein
MRVIPVRDLDTGWTIASIAGRTVVPDYPYSALSSGMDEMQRRQELDLDWTASTGKRVYPEFGPIHCSIDPLPYDEHLPLICGWDLPASTGGTPAFAPTQLSDAGQWMIYPPVCAEESEQVGTYAFGERVARYLREEFAEPSGVTLDELKLIHWADPAGNAPPIRTYGMNPKQELRSAYQTLLNGEREFLYEDEEGEPVYHEKPGFGWMMQPGEMSIQGRQAAMRARLTALLPGGVPALIVDPNADIILVALKGGYCFDQRTDGRYELDPTKNKFSHVVNALEYAASRLSYARPKRREDDDRPSRARWRAPGRSRW